jgi:DDE superfamily endonuclease
MCCYATEVVNGALAGVDEDTFRKWTTPWIRAISLLSLELVDFDMRFEGNWHYWTFCVDGKHCPIQEPRRPFWKGWFSHKYQHAGLSYEIATACTTGKIIWTNGPFPAGKWPDPKIFRRDLAHLVRTDIERGICDAGYMNCERWLYKAIWRTKKALEEGMPRNDLHDYIRARHEQTNGRLNKFNCLSCLFRHDIRLHTDYFHACVSVVQLEIIFGFASQFDVIPKPYVCGEEPLPQPPPA